MEGKAKVLSLFSWCSHYEILVFPFPSVVSRTRCFLLTVQLSIYSSLPQTCGLVSDISLKTSMQYFLHKSQCANLSVADTELFWLLKSRTFSLQSSHTQNVPVKHQFVHLPTEFNPVHHICSMQLEFLNMLLVQHVPVNVLRWKIVFAKVYFEDGCNICFVFMFTYISLVNVKFCKKVFIKKDHNVGLCTWHLW